MKPLTKITVLMGLLLLFVPILQAQTSVSCDTILFVPSLSGGMVKYLCQEDEWSAGTFIEEYSWYPVGEYFSIAWGACIVRAYFTFELPIELEVEDLDSAHAYLYQELCWGDGQDGKYPHWDVPGGDTIFCTLDHVQFDTIKTGPP